MPTPITSPDDPALAELCGDLAGRAAALDVSGAWPAEQLRLCGEYGVYLWFAAPEWGGQAWPDVDVLRGYLALSAACLTTTFILTQRQGACRRLEASGNAELKEKLLPRLARGETFATVGISHLTTSRRHVGAPVLTARRVERGYVLNGYSPWITGASHADYIVVGATVVEGDHVDEPLRDSHPRLGETRPRDDSRLGETRPRGGALQLLAVVPTGLPGVWADEPERLVALSASHTGKFHLNDVVVGDEWVVDGPVENVMSRGAGAGTGGLQTSTLALGLGQAAIDFLAGEAARRPEFGTPLEALRADHEELKSTLLAAVEGRAACSNDELRQQANNLALRSTQAALAAAKGAGYVLGHPAGRWAREALFFLVWSCPQPVVAAHLCELAGVLE
jgi:alkylation response protein AidB-like acyl-CoA dehydrogenase